MTMSLFKDFNARPVRPLSSPLGPHENFDILITAAVGTRSPLGLTTEVFAECVNATYALRYYFQEPSERDLASIGLYRQGYWLRPRPGAERLLVSIPKVAAILEAAQARR